MKKMIILIMLVFIAGCATTAWYQEEKKVEEATQDWKDCVYRSMGWELGFYVCDPESLKQCMLARGYKEVAKSELKKNKQILIYRPSSILMPSVAGE